MPKKKKKKNRRRDAARATGTAVRGTRPWVVGGFIVARKLPKESLDLATASITSESDETIRKLPRRRPVITEFGFPEAPGYQVIGPELRVRSNAVIRLFTDASDPEEAQAGARSELPLITASLNTVLTAPCRTELLHVEAIEPPHQGGSTWSATAKTQQIQPTALTDAETEAIVRRLDRLRVSAVGQAAARHLHEALLAEDADVVAPQMSAHALLSYFKVVELISSRVAAHERRALRSNITTAQEAIASQLAERLVSIRPTSRVAAIREASRGIDLAEWRYMQLQIERTGEVLGLDRLIVQQASELCLFRNERLGHAGTEYPAEGVHLWMVRNEAFKVAVAYLAGFLDSESSESTRSEPVES